MKRPSIRLTFFTVALAIAGIAVVGGVKRDAAACRLRETILAELRPVAFKNCDLKRFGSANDGGYLMCENLIEPLAAAYSYSVGPNDDWGCEVSRRYRGPVHEYDCFDPGAANLQWRHVPLSQRMYWRPDGLPRFQIFRHT